MPLLLVGCEKDRLDERAKELCAKDGGVTVHEVVKLPAEKFDQWGNVRIPEKSDATPSDAYFYVRETTYLKTGNPEMWRSHHQVIRRSDGKLLGESVSAFGKGYRKAEPLGEGFCANSPEAGTYALWRGPCGARRTAPYSRSAVPECGAAMTEPSLMPRTVR